MDWLKVKLEMMYEVFGGKKVDIIMYFMGGIVLKFFLVFYFEVNDFWVIVIIRLIVLLVI